MSQISHPVFGQNKKSISRDEMNLAEFPLTVLSTRSNPKIKTLEFNDYLKNKNGELINRKWIITGADKFGLPTASDDEVLLGLLKLTVDSEMKSPKVYFTRYEILKILKWTTEGRSYKRLQNALDRLSGVRIKATNAFYDNESKLHNTKNFGLIDGYEINDGRDDNKRSFFIWSEVLFKSFQVGYIKKLDLDFYLTLKSSISKRLYRYLDKHFWYKSTVQMNLMVFAHEKIGISKNYKFTSSIRQQLDPAIEELIECGFLQGVDYQGRGSGTEIILSASIKNKNKTAIVREEKNDSYDDVRNSGNSIKKVEVKISNNLYSQVFEMLEDRGMKAAQVKNLIEVRTDLELERILQIIEHFDSLRAAGSSRVSKSPVGFLYRAVERPESYILPHELKNSAQQTNFLFDRDSKRGAGQVHSAVNNAAAAISNSSGANFSSANAARSAHKPKTGENLETRYLIERKEKIKEIKLTVEYKLLTSLRNDVATALQKLKGLISETRFTEAVEHGVEEKLAKLFALPDFTEWCKKAR